jgi:hypothetical protein
MKEEQMSEEVKIAAEKQPTIDEIIANLQGFGLQDFEEPLVIKSGDKEITIQLSNIPTEEEMNALLAVEEYKGYAWMQQIKCEILSRAISSVNGINIRTMKVGERTVTDPKDSIQKDIQVVLRNLLLGWGQEFIGVLWKVLMTHAQRIEDSLRSQFPESALMTEYEKRFLEQAIKEIDEQNVEVIKEAVKDLYTDSEAETLPGK